MLWYGIVLLHGLKHSIQIFPQSQDMMDVQMEQLDWSTPSLNMKGEWKCVQMECGEQSVEWIAVMLLSSVEPLGTVEVRGTEYS